MVALELEVCTEIHISKVCHIVTDALRYNGPYAEVHMHACCHFQAWPYLNFEHPIITALKSCALIASTPTTYPHSECIQYK